MIMRVHRLDAAWPSAMGRFGILALEAFMNTLARFVRDESGATAIEYGLIAALIAVVIIVGLTTVGTKLNTMFGTKIAGNL
jgi:pilus assembly protein Flp/PilA